MINGRFVFGRVVNCGNIQYGNFVAEFPVETIPALTNWKNLKIAVDNAKNVKVYLDNVYKGDFKAHFNTRGMGGVAIANGYGVTCQFRDFEIVPKN